MNNKSIHFKLLYKKNIVIKRFKLKTLFLQQLRKNKNKIMILVNKRILFQVEMNL